MLVRRLLFNNSTTKRYLSHHHAPIPNHEFAVVHNNIKTINENIKTINESISGLGNLLALNFFLLNGIYVPVLLVVTLLKN